MEEYRGISRRHGRRAANYLIGILWIPMLLVAGCAEMGLEKNPAQTAAQTAAQTSTVAPTGDITEEAYRIGPEDVLEITVLGEETLNKRALVDPDGWIAFPMVGQVLAAGSTPGELERELTDKLKGLIRDPVVSVALADAAGYRVYVVGRVEKPGQFLAGSRIDVLKAIALAGGLTPFADQDDIKILRRSGTGDQVFPFDYGAIRRGNKLEQNIVLQSGDVVLVP